MILRKIWVTLAMVATTAAVGQPLEPGDKIVIVPQSSAATSATAIAIKRIAESTSATVTVDTQTSAGLVTDADLVILLGVGLSPQLATAKEDSYAVETTSATGTLTVRASGTGNRSMLYAAYRLADLLRAGKELNNLSLIFQPKIKERFVSFGATTHGRREYHPELFWKTLNELPRFGYNGVIIYPGGGTPLGRHSSPLVETKDGKLTLDPENTARWKDWLAKVDAYGLDIMMTVPPSVPAGYDMKDIREYYSGGPEPKDYLKNLKSNFRNYLELLTRTYPEADLYMFNSTEGATFGRNFRFFGHPSSGKYPVDAYLRNNEAIMTAYFDVLKDFFGDELHKVMFWTHSFGLTSDGIRKMREILFQYPAVTIIEDDFWNNNLWPFELPAMAYLPTDLRAKVSENNPFALFQIATDGEYYGGGSLPNAYPDSHVRSAKEAVERNARMMIQRLDLHDRTPYGTAFGTMEIVPLAASRQIWEPEPTIDETWHNWAERRFGTQAAPYVVKALQESESIIHKGLSCNGIDLLCVGSEFSPRLWMQSDTGVTRFYLFGKPGRDFVADEDDVISSEEFTAYQMDTHSIAIEDWRKNQEEARQAVERGLAQIEKARPYLTEPDYEMLKGIYTNGRHVLHAVRLLGQAAYATNIMLDNFDEVEDPDAHFNKAMSDLEQFLDQEKIIPEMTRNIRKIVDHYKEVARRGSEKK